MQEIPNLIVFKELTKFLVYLKDLTVCHITQMEMIHPYVATYHQSYKKYAISHWLGLYSKFPVTRKPMQMHCIMQDHTMNKLISSMKECNIADELIINIYKSFQIQRK